MRAPRFGQLPRWKHWSRPTIVYALQQFEREHGRRLVSNDISRAAPPGVPSHEAIRHHFGTFSAATQAAYGEALPTGGQRKVETDLDTERVIFELESGRTLTELAAERGMTGQALGRRVTRYKQAQGMSDTKLRPGRPPRA